jgi:hypothetical protein
MRISFDPGMHRLDCFRKKRPNRFAFEHVHVHVAQKPDLGTGLIQPATWIYRSAIWLMTQEAAPDGRKA